jgi:hypothetical protein
MEEWSMSFWYLASDLGPFGLQYIFGTGKRPGAPYSRPGFGLAGGEQEPPCTNLKRDSTLITDAKTECASAEWVEGFDRMVWYHCVLVKQSNRFLLYSQGARKWSGVLENFELDSLVFGERVPNWLEFNGFIDDVGIWNRSLSEKEVSDLYSSHKCSFSISSDSILGYRNVETHQVVTYALRNNPALSYKWIATGGYMLGASTNHFCDVIWGYDKNGSVCCIVSDSTCTDTICVTTTINNSPTGGIAGEDIETPTMSVKPNPAADMIDISTALGEQFARYELVDVTGIVVQRTEGISTRMSVADVAPGVYHIVQRDTMGNIIGMQRVVVKR